MRKAVSFVVLIALALASGLVLQTGMRAGEKPGKKPSADEIAKQWVFAFNEVDFKGQTHGKLRWIQMPVEKKGKYEEVFTEAAKFYFEKIGYDPKYAQPKKLLFGGTGETKDGGKFIVTDLGSVTTRSLLLVYDRPEYTVNVLVGPDSLKKTVYINVTVAVR